jgi:hypothetical protein
MLYGGDHAPSAGNCRWASFQLPLSPIGPALIRIRPERNERGCIGRRSGPTPLAPSLLATWAGSARKGGIRLDAHPDSRVNDPGQDFRNDEFPLFLFVGSAPVLLSSRRTTNQGGGQYADLVRLKAPGKAGRGTSLDLTPPQGERRWRVPRMLPGAAALPQNTRTGTND